jgi:hypothetical protein
MKECVWVEPRIAAEVEFLEWTGADHLRHTKFVGLRDDKDPLKVVREPSHTRFGDCISFEAASCGLMNCANFEMQLPASPVNLRTRIPSSAYWVVRNRRFARVSSA